MIQLLISYFKKRLIQSEYLLSEDDREKNYWAWQKESASTVIKDLAVFTQGEWRYRHCKDLVYTEGVRYFVIQYAMQELMDAFGKIIYHLHKKPYFDNYKTLLNISKDKKVALYIRHKQCNTLVYSQSLQWVGTLPTTRVIVFNLKRIHDLSFMQRCCMNFDRDEIVNYVYGVSLISEEKEC